jgi:hypothetical protein
VRKMNGLCARYATPWRPVGGDPAVTVMQTRGTRSERPILVLACRLIMATRLAG